MTIPEIEVRLLNLIERCRELGVPLGELNEMVSLARAREPGIALENLCTQLFEYEAHVPADVLETIKRLGMAMGLADKYWMRLESPSA